MELGALSQAAWTLATSARSRYRTAHWCSMFMSRCELTPREKHIAQLLATNHSAKVVADKLNITENTVDTHRQRIFKKLGLRGQVLLTHYALAHGWVQNIYQKQATNENHEPDNYNTTGTRGRVLCGKRIAA